MKTFNLILSDIKIAVTVCGADVIAASTLCGWINFPCLTHVINLIAKKGISPPTDDTTRWNSLLDMLVRFQLLRPFLEIMIPSDLEDYDWHSLERCIKILRPSQESALLLQKGNADVQTAKSVIKYLRYITSAEPVLNSPMHDTLSKWVGNNLVVNENFSPDNLQNEFTKQVFEFASCLNSTVPSSSDDHSYVPNHVLLLNEFLLTQEANDFDVRLYMKNFIPTSCDTERLFSLCRISKNFLQCRMSNEHYARNVFLAKKIAFFDLT